MEEADGWPVMNGWKYYFYQNGGSFDTSHHHIFNPNTSLDEHFNRTTFTQGDIIKLEWGTTYSDWNVWHLFIYVNGALWDYTNK